MHCTSEDDGKSPLQLVVLWWDRQTSGNEKLVSLGTKEQIGDGKTIFMGFCEHVFLVATTCCLSLSRFLIEQVGNGPYLTLILGGDFNPFSWCSWVLSNLEWWLLGEKNLKFYPNSFVQVAKYFFRVKNGDESPKKNIVVYPLKTT